MAGYAGYSKSNNAVQAEREGRYPLSIAKKVLQELFISDFGWKVSLKDCTELLEQEYDGEWHHSSKFYNRINYYNVAGLINTIKTYINSGNWEEEFFNHKIPKFALNLIKIHACDDYNILINDLKHNGYNAYNYFEGAINE